MIFFSFSKVFYNSGFQRSLCGGKWQALSSHSYLTLTGRLECWSMLNCPIGQFGSTVDDDMTSCNDCGAGKYNEQVEQSTSAACKDCASDTFSTVAASSCPYSATSCPPGTYASGTASCDACGVGMYNDQVGQSTCKDCGIGMYNDQIGQTVPACKDCGIGKYNNQVGQFSCRNCYLGKYSGKYAKMGQYGYVDVFYVGQSLCKFNCATGKYGKYLYNAQVAQSTEANACQMCASGKYSGAAGQSSCTTCAGGSFSTAAASSCPYSATSCPPGTYASGTASCDPCGAGGECGSANLVD